MKKSLVVETFLKKNKKKVDDYDCAFRWGFRFEDEIDVDWQETVYGYGEGSEDEINERVKKRIKVSRNNGDKIYIKDTADILKFEVKKNGRPQLGVTKKVSVTMPEDHWSLVEEIADMNDMSISAVFRSFVSETFEPEYLEKRGWNVKTKIE